MLDFQYQLSYEPILAFLLHTHLYIVIFKLFNFWWAKYWGGGPCFYGHDFRHATTNRCDMGCVNPVTFEKYLKLIFRRWNKRFIQFVKVRGGASR